MQTTTRRVPLGPAQRNWLRYLQANPGPNYAELGKRQLIVLQSLERRGLISITLCDMRSPKGRPVYALQAVTANGERGES